MLRVRLRAFDWRWRTRYKHASHQRPARQRSVTSRQRSDGECIALGTTGGTASAGGSTSNPKSNPAKHIAGTSNSPYTAAVNWGASNTPANGTSNSPYTATVNWGTGNSSATTGLSTATAPAGTSDTKSSAAKHEQ
jgi:hypothetical protein